MGLTPAWPYGGSYRGPYQRPPTVVSGSRTTPLVGKCVLAYSRWVWTCSGHWPTRRDERSSTSFMRVTARLIIMWDSSFWIPGLCPPCFIPSTFSSMRSS